MVGLTAIRNAARGSGLPHRLPALLLVPGLAGASGCATALPWEPNAEATEIFTEEFHSGDLLDLRNVNGRVSIAAWDRSQAEITARKVGADDSALDEVSVEIQQTSMGLQVRTRRPKRRGMWGGKHGAVHYAIRLPERADLRIETVNGSVEVSGISGEVAIQTVNGSLLLTGQRGSVNAQTVNGRIECAFDRFGPGDEHSFRTVNGKVLLTLDSEANGRVDAQAVNGRVVMELAGAEELDIPTRRRKTVQLGEGGGECRVRTVNGAIHIGTGGS